LTQQKPPITQYSRPVLIAIEKNAAGQADEISLASSDELS
jgi:hypothetical protein